MNTQNTTFKVKALVLSLGLSVASFAQAQSNNEVQQLRQEVQELKNLLQQYSQQQQQQAVELQAVQVQAQSQPDGEKKGLAVTKGGAEFSIYGNVRADASYQIKGGNEARLYNQINTIPLGDNREGNDRLKSTLAATRLGLDFKTATQMGDIGGKLEMDFLGANDSLRIRHAYLNYGNWLIGQTWSNFAVPDYMPETIDALGYVGGSVKRNPQVRYTNKFDANTNLVMALEDPKDSSSSMRLPALSARLNHKFADTGAVSLRAMVNEKKTTEDNETAWGVGLGVKYDLTPKTTLKADYYHVKGDSSFVAWANPGFVVNGVNDIVETNQFNSIQVGITQQFNPQWRGTLGYGYMKADDNQNYINSLADPTKANKNLWQAWGNMFYSPTKPVSLGLEYVYGEREAFKAAANGSNTGEDNRVSAVAIYNF